MPLLTVKNLSELTHEEIVDEIAHNIHMSALEANMGNHQALVDYNWDWCSQKGLIDLYEQGYKRASELLGF
jgi:hypothetical protein